MSLQLCNRVASWNHSSPQQNLPPLLYITTSCGGVHLGGTPSGVYPGFYITHFDLLLLHGKKGGELPRAKPSNSEVAICPATSHGNSQTSQVCPHFTKLPHFHLLSYQPLLFPWNTNPNSSPAMNDCIHRGEQVWESTHEQLEQVVQIHKVSRDQDQGENPCYQLGDRVWLATKEFRQPQTCKKINHRYIGPYKVIKQINLITCKLDHVSHLKPVIPGPLASHLKIQH